MREDVTWSPNVQVGTVTYKLQVDAGPVQILGFDHDIMSPAEIDFDPNDYGSPGQTYTVWIEATDVVGCPDFTSNHPTLVF
jgi:hypothetical protein